MLRQSGFALLFLAMTQLACTGMMGDAESGAQDSEARKNSGERDQDCYDLVQDGTVLGQLQLTSHGDLLAGDMVLGRVPQQGFNLGYGNIHNFVGMGSPWPDGKVPYEIEGGSNDFRSRVTAAIDQMDTQLGDTIDFVVKTDESNFIAVVPISGNISTSNVGMVGGRQELRLVTSFPNYVLWHELGHALGLFHEQNRQDRDDYITVNDGNIPANLELAYAKLLGDPIGTFDYESIMLYDSCGGYSPRGCGSPHFVLNSGGQHRARQALSAGDIAAIEYLYSPVEDWDARSLMPPQYEYASSNSATFVIKAMPEDTELTTVAYTFGSGRWSVYGRTDIPAFVYGGRGHVPVVGNYYGDDAAEQAFFFPGKRKWFYGERAKVFPADEIAGDLVPVPFDFDGDSYLDLAVFSRATGEWHIEDESAAIEWSQDGGDDVPVPGNYGSERGQIAWFNPDTKQFGFRDNEEILQFDPALEEPAPVIADYDGDDVDDPGVYDYATGDWYYASSRTGDLMKLATGEAGRLPFAVDQDLDGEVEFKLLEFNDSFMDVDLRGEAKEVPWPEAESSDDDEADSDDDDDDDDDENRSRDRDDDDDDRDTKVKRRSCGDSDEKRSRNKDDDDDDDRKSSKRKSKKK